MTPEHSIVATLPDGGTASLRAVDFDGPRATLASGAAVATSLWRGAGKPTVASGSVTDYHIPVLMYHRIAPGSERGHDLVDLVIDPKVLDRQLAVLKAHGWHTITSAGLAETIAAKQGLPDRTFVITFDDGHVDGYTHAFPILKKYGFVATFFVITGRVDHSGYLSWDEMLEMQAAGMEIGNHTVSHRDETRFSRSQADFQVRGAQRAITTHLGVAPVSFAYPSGRTPANLVAAVEASGMEVAYTTAHGTQETLGTAYLLPRIRIHPTTTASNLVAFLDHDR